MRRLRASSQCRCCLGIAYSASIGGVATPIGTPPNGVFLAAYKTATGATVPFHQWLVVGGTIAVLMLAVAWVVLTWKLARRAERRRRNRRRVDDPAEAHPHRARPHRARLDHARDSLRRLVGSSIGATQAGDTTVALVAVVVLFLVPSGAGDGKRLLDWATAKQIPWGVLLLFGGGIAIAKAFEVSGLSTSIGELVNVLHDWPTLAVLGVLCLAVTFFSEFTSNTATSNILMPILAAAAAANQHRTGAADVPRHAVPTAWRSCCRSARRPTRWSSARAASAWPTWSATAWC